MRPVWIIGYPRTGSHHLAECINITRVFPHVIDEWMCLWPELGTGVLRGAGRRWLQSNKLPVESKSFRQALPPYSVVHDWHYTDCLSIEDKLHVKESLPGLRYVWLRRRDLVAVAVSTFIARRTKTYFVNTDEEVRTHASMPVKLDRHLFNIYDTVLERDTFWGKYLSPEDECLTTYYEDMVEESEKRRIFDFLGIEQPVPEDNVYKKLNHPMTEELCDVLRRRIKLNLSPPTPLI